LCTLLPPKYIIPTHTVANYDEVTALFRKYRSEGLEGVIVKDPRMPWENRRSKMQIKIKGVEEADLLCTGWTEGTGKYKGMLGAIQLQTRDGLLKVDVGSGFSDKQRKELKKKDVMDQIISIEYNEKIQKKDGTWSLFLPIFIEIRKDKDEADAFKDLK
jgi:ATP-dependent DNA ligase